MLDRLFNTSVKKRPLALNGLPQKAIKSSIEANLDDSILQLFT
jgi:hypothetical protein